VVPSDLTLFGLTILAVLGAVLGSGMTALAWRLPRKQSWVAGRSRCTACGRVLGPLDLVPVFSWLFSLGRCRACGARVSVRYPLMELACAAWAVLIGLKLGWTVALAPVLLWGVLLVALFMIDLEVQLLPDALTFPGTLLALVAAALGPGLRHALLGIVVGAGYLWLFLWLWEKVLKREGMGGGDVKLGAMFGALTGPVGAFVTISLAAFGGSLVGLVLMATRRGNMRTALPFGTFLAPAAMAAYLWGQGWVDAYLGLLQR
jgi:leader peptidase (prepilin peptidase) / N-methyltransferase